MQPPGRVRGGNPLGCAYGNLRGPPRYDKKTSPFTVARGPVPRQHSRARSCSSGSPDPDPFVIRRSQTTEVETHIVTMELAGETRSDARMETSEGPRATIKNAASSRSARACPSPASAQSNARGGQAPALRGNQDRAGATTGNRDREVSPTEEHKKRQRILKIRCPRKRNSRKLTLYLL